jgi:hypothetical protein
VRSHTAVRGETLCVVPESLVAVSSISASPHLFISSSLVSSSLSSQQRTTSTAFTSQASLSLTSHQNSIPLPSLRTPPSTSSHHSSLLDLFHRRIYYYSWDSASPSASSRMIGVIAQQFHPLFNQPKLVTRPEHDQSTTRTRTPNIKPFPHFACLTLVYK